MLAADKAARAENAPPQLPTTESRLVARTGLSIVYEPMDKESVIDIVFIHGLQGHPKLTWYRESSKPGWKQRLTFQKRQTKLVTENEQAQDKGVFWPADLLPLDCPDARILTFGYDSTVTKFFGGAVSQNDITANAKNLMYAINRSRVSCYGRPLIFVAHSLGGIIIKEVIHCIANEEDGSTLDIKNSTKAIVFLGTPHRGSGYAPIGEIIRRIVAATGFDTNDQNLRALHFDSRELERSRNEFYKQWKEDRFVVKTFQEARGLRGLQGLNRKVVPDFSSSLDDPREHAEHIDANHMGMCRFTSKDDNGYRQVGGELKLLVKQLCQENKTQGIKDELEKPGQNEEREADPVSPEERACLQSLCFLEIDFRQNNICKTLDYTCEWLFERPEYLTWIDSKCPGETPSLLWIKGKPGSGKSTLMKKLLRHIQAQLREPNATKVCFFFNAQGTALEKTPLGLFRSVLYQILQQSRHLLREFMPLYRRKIEMHGTTWEWHRQELEEFLGAATKILMGPLVIIIDALDECEEISARELVTFFEDLISASPTYQSNIRICLSSRYYPNIHAERCMEICMDDHNEPDIRTYVERRLRPCIQLSGFSHLVAEIVRKASGVFLWVVLVVKSLIKAMDEGESINRMRQIVRDIPEQLTQLIKQTILSVSVDHRLETLHIMQWVLLASKPLSTTELRYALVFGEDPTHISQALATMSPNFIDCDNKTEKLIRSRTKGLVEVKQGRADIDYLEPNGHCPKRPDTVQFIHESVRDFLFHQHGLQILGSFFNDSAIVQSQYYLTRTCINYLGISELHDLPASSSDPSTLTTLQAEDIFKKQCNAHPFLEYAVTAVFNHAKNAESLTEPNSFFAEPLMTGMQRVFNVWRYVSDLDRRTRLREISGPHTTFAHIAVEYDMIDWVKSLLRQGVDVNITGGRFYTLIQTASAMGHEKLVNTLLESGADIHLRGGRHENVLTAAAYYGNQAIVRAILAKGPKVNALGGEYMTALQAAAGSLEGNEEIIQLLLDANADVHVQGGKHGSALQAGAFKGNEKVVQLLLDAGADVNAQGGEHGSALQAAAFRGHESIVRMLLEKDADVTIQAGNYGTALWAAAYSGHANIVRQILTLGYGNTNESTFKEDCTATLRSLESQVQEVMNVSMAIKKFHEAAEKGDIATMQEMLDMGVSVNVRGGDLGSAWHTAAFYGYSDVMSLLLSQPHPNPDMRDSRNRTPLWFAAGAGHESIVQKLLDTGLVDRNIKSDTGRNLLWWPSNRGYTGVVSLMLQRGVSPHETDVDGLSPLMTAREEGQSAVMNLLLEADPQST